MSSSPNALLGVKVLDMSRVLAGPFCGMLLADMGADVIKLEVPGRGDDSREFPPFKEGQSLYFTNLNRGKRGVTLNLKDEEGKRVFLELVRKCDVLIENFSPGTMERLGLGYEELRKANPRLVYAAISGFGQTGPYRSRPGYDIIGQAMGGLLSVTGWPDSPPTRSGTAIGDILSSLFCTIGILAALNIRERTGRGSSSTSPSSTRSTRRWRISPRSSSSRARCRGGSVTGTSSSTRTTRSKRGTAGWSSG